MNGHDVFADDDSGIVIRPLETIDFDSAISLWRSVPGLLLRDEDNASSFSRFIDHNRGLSWGAWCNAELIGAALAGSDGWRGYLYHFAVASAHQRQGVGSRLLRVVEEGLAIQGIERTHITVLCNNVHGGAFWQATGWEKRTDLVTFSKRLQLNTLRVRVT